MPGRTCGPVNGTDSGQVRRYRGFVQLAGDARRGEGGFHRAGEDEAVRRPGVVEGPDADRVPGAEQQTVARVLSNET